MQYYGTKLTENISRREPEGYLLCLNVPVARTGMQEYLPEELGLPACSGTVPVHRPEEEVFAPETLASFEGMPVTNNHPPDGVDIENIRRLQMGHAHNVRRGTGEESDLLLADLIITDPVLIDAILAGKREISCGYTYELHEENGQYIQRKIRGNHIAVVDAGRAGPRVSIKDHKSERRNTTMKKSLTKLLARMAKDGDIETVAEFIEEMINEESGAEPVAEAAAEIVEEAAEAAAEGETVTVEVPENREITIDEDGITGIIQRLDQLIALLTPPIPAEEPAEDEENGEGAGEPIAEEIAEVIEEAIEAANEESEPTEAAEELSEIVESILEPEVSSTIEEEEEGDCGTGCDPEKASASDALRAALLVMRPVLSKMPRKQRRKVCADIAASLRKGRRGNDGIYSAIAAASRRNGDPRDLGKRIMEKRNPNYRK